MVGLHNMIVWNGLPAIIVGESDEKKIVVFSNLNGEFVLCEILYSEKDDIEIYNAVSEQGFFDCLATDKSYISDELTVILSLTEKCNCRCKYCFLDAETHGEIMTKELLRTGITKACEIANGRNINFSAFGGEPGTESALLKEMIDYAKEKYENSKIKFSITTNGVFSNEVCDLLIDNKFSISLSMDGIPKVQNYQRPLPNGKESYKLVERNLKKLVMSECKLKIRCTVTEFSVKYMSDAVEWLHKLGVKRVHFEPVTSGGRGCSDNISLQPPKAEVFVENLIKSIEIGAKYGMDIICFPYMNMMVAPIVFCDGRAENRMVISPRGVVSSCVEVQTKDHELYPYLGLGEYNSKTSSIEFEFDERRQGLRGCHALVETKPICKNCPLKFFCGGGCPTRNYRGSGNTDVVDQYRCDIIRLIMPYVLEKFYYESINS